MRFKHVDDSINKLLLSSLGCLIYRSISSIFSWKPGIGSTGLYNHDVLVGILAFESLDCRFECGDCIMPNGIIAKSDDVVVNTVGLHAVVEVGEHVCLSGTLGVENNLGIRTNLTTSLSGILEQCGEVTPVGFFTHIAFLE